MIVVLILSLPFLFIAGFKPVLRRLALRNASRRPREAVLVVIGSLLGTAIMTGSFIVGDTLAASIRSFAFTQLGPVDELIATTDPAAAPEIERRVRDVAGTNRDIDGVLAFRAGGAAVLAGQGKAVRAVSRATLLETDFNAARRFGGDEHATGIDGATPAAGHTAINVDLARKLDIGAGDTVTVFGYGRSLPLVVDRLLPRRGVAGFFVGRGSRSYTLFLAPGTLAGLAGPAGSGVSRFAPPQSLVAISNRGGVLDGERRTTAVEHVLVPALAGVPAHVDSIKHDTLDTAERAGKDFTQLFGTMGMFGVVAGILLLVNIFVMLAEERKSELGMLRAVGLRRSALVAAFSMEGWLYALASAFVGTLFGFGLGRIIVIAAAKIFAGGRDEFRLDLQFVAKPSSLQAGFAIGFVIALVTVVLTSIRISRFNIIGAIRDLPDTAARRSSRWSLLFGILVLLLGAQLTITGARRDTATPLLLGPMMVMAGLVPLLGRRLPRRLVVSAASAGVLLWGIFAFNLVFNQDAQLTLFVAEGVALTAAAVALISQNQEVLGDIVRRFRTHSLDLRLGVAYPLARRFRTGMTLAMYALVIFTLTFITTLGHVFATQIDGFTARLAGGYDVFARSNPANPIPAEELAARRGVVAVAPIATISARFERKPDGDTVAESHEWPLSAIDERFLARRPPRLEDRGRYPNDAAAYRAVIADPNLAMVDRFFLQDGGGPPKQHYRPGDKLRIIDPFTDHTRVVTIAAIAGDDFLANGALYGVRGGRDLFGDRLVANHAYVALGSGVDAEKFSTELQGAYLTRGADVQSFRGLVHDQVRQQEQFFLLIRGYLALGLVVGIAGLGVIMVRAVRERRRQIGVLRSLGFATAAVRRSFVFESAFVALEGVVIGVVLALLTAYNLFANSTTFGDNAHFAIPVLELVVLVVATFLASMFATAAPARSASRIQPAVALRISD